MLRIYGHIGLVTLWSSFLGAQHRWSSLSPNFRWNRDGIWKSGSFSQKACSIGDLRAGDDLSWKSNPRPIVHPRKQPEIFGMKAIGISLPPYSIYKQNFNFRSVTLPEISFDEKSVIYNYSPSHPISSVWRHRASAALRNKRFCNNFAAKLYNAERSNFAK